MYEKELELARAAAVEAGNYLMILKEKMSSCRQIKKVRRFWQKGFLPQDMSSYLRNAEKSIPMQRLRCAGS